MAKGKGPGRINLALQGGGAHGAFTWGVLDRLLAEGIEPAWISGTSAGAVNAVALAAGLAAGGTVAAREKLRDVWAAVARAAAPDLMRMLPLFAGMQRSGALARMTAVFSPYDLNPLGFDPLRKVLEAQIDFTLLRTTRGPELLIAATDIATGRARLFRRAEMTVEAVLASACLPTIHHAVEIEGRAYWDGGYSANPDLLTLALESPVDDTLIVQLSPLTKPGLPTSARDIAAHVAHVTFNQPFVRDLDLIVAAREREARRSSWWPRRATADRRIARHRFHLIDSGRFTSSLAPDSKVRPELALLTYLFDAGSDETAKWIERNRQSIGRRDTAELGRRLEDARTRAIGKQPQQVTGASR